MSSSAFLQDKTSFYQQNVEKLNAELLRLFGEMTRPDQAVLLGCEFLRILKWIKHLYHRPIGRVLACGSDDCSALGLRPQNAGNEDDSESEYPPRFTLNLPPNVIRVAAGGIHSTALTQDGHVYTWGSNDECALGRTVRAGEEHFVARITEFPPFANGRIVDVSAGDGHTLFMTIDGQVLVCGTYKDFDSGLFPPLKPGETLKNGMKQQFPIEIKLPMLVRKIAAGENMDAVILEDETLYTWGMGHCGELARSESMGAPLVKENETSDRMVHDLKHAFVKTTVTTQKQNEEGEWEDVTESEYNTELIKRKFLTPAPVEWEIPGKYQVLDVAVGCLHLLVVARTGGKTLAFSSGHNQYGQLGHGDQLQRHKLTLIKALEDEIISQVAAGSFHSLFLNLTGTGIWSCGRADYGQLGLLERKNKDAGDFRDTPQLVPFPSEEVGQIRFKHIEAGSSSSAAILDNDDIYTWGMNEQSQSGHPYKKDVNDSTDIERPKRLNPMRYYKKKDPRQGTTASALDVSCGGQHSLFLVHPYK